MGEYIVPNLQTPHLADKMIVGVNSGGGLLPPTLILCHLHQVRPPTMMTLILLPF